MNAPLPEVTLPQAGRPPARDLLQKLLDLRERAAHAHQQYQAAEAEYKRACEARDDAERAVKTIPELQAGAAIVHAGSVFILERDSMTLTPSHKLRVFPLAE